MFPLCLVLIFGMVFTGISIRTVLAAPDQQASAYSAIMKVSETIEAAETIYQELKESIADTIAEADVEDDDSNFDAEEADAGVEELKGYIKQLDDLLSGLNGLPDDLTTSDGKTVRAAKEYLTMLKNMTADLTELVKYSIDFYVAVQEMDYIDGDTDDFYELAEQIWNGCDMAKTLMEEIKPPSYLEITHKEMIIRITEFRDFGLDFYIACDLGDPLRIYSCVYRMDRIIRMFNVCDNNLSADIDLQFKQAERRLNGTITQLHDELIRNISLLKAAYS
jgi:hypothetical protein